MFEWLLENTNYEYFFRTNTSSYIKPDKLREHIEHINMINICMLDTFLKNTKILYFNLIMQWSRIFN